MVCYLTVRGLGTVLRIFYICNTFYISPSVPTNWLRSFWGSSKGKVEHLMKTSAEKTTNFLANLYHAGWYASYYAIYPTFLVVLYVPTCINCPGTQLHFPVHLPWGQVQRLCTSLRVTASASVSLTNVWYHHHHHHHGLYHHHNHHQVIMESGHHDLSGAWQMPTVQSTGAAPKLTSTAFTSEDPLPSQG